MHHNTKFGNKMFGSSGDIWINIDISTLHCNLDLKCTKPMYGNLISSQDALAYNNLLKKTKFGRKRIANLENIAETVIF